MASYHRSERLTKLKYEAFGLVLIILGASFVALTVAVYEKAFSSAVSVTLETDHVGNQLDPGADVKVRGVLVGEVRSISTAGNGATLDLAIDPGQLSVIPANVTAQLLPKTLFGEKYVALEIPATPEGQLYAGEVIGQDRSSTAIEVEKVLGDVMPLLQAVQPQQLAGTLNAMSTALSGRGAQLGQTLVRLENYLHQLNPQLSTIDSDIQRFSSVADTYDQAAPRLLGALSDLTTTSRTLVEAQDNLRTLYGTLTTSGTDLQDFLRTNENNTIRLVSDSTPVLNVLARYAPEYPCFLRAVVASIPAADKAFGKGTDHPDSSQINVVIAASRGRYVPGQDIPQWNDDRGPRCYTNGTATNRSPQYPADGPFDDGSTHPPPPKGTWDGNLQDLPGAPTTSGTNPQAAAEPAQLANSAAEQQLLAALVAPGLGVGQDTVPDWASLLVGPLFRGAVVTVK
ncbi:MAG TPA: MCE family protein [Pseudonocardiaceae bacterium]|jgi:virulence factor Mce-like protein|nr:MCE family protein [Pseudonocardiaceae bacterium]